MYDSLTIAHFFVKQSWNTKIPITPFKTEFLVCFAHGWHLAIDGRPLISEKIKAWRHGPVIESINKFYSKNKSGDIYATLDIHALNKIKGMDADFLMGVWAYYGHLNELEMLSLCTDEETPWQITYAKSSGKLLIHNYLIKLHYRRLHMCNPEFCDIEDPITIKGRPSSHVN